jgi:cephalosporin hydroxylase
MRAPIDLQAPKSLMANHDHAGALSILDPLAADRPTDIEVERLRLDCLMAIGQFEKATQSVEKILSLDPGHAHAKQLKPMLAAAMAKPALAPAKPGLRAFHSEIPQAFMLRIQQAVHHYRYRGVQLVKDPFDLAIYPMLIWSLRPGTIIEIGSKAGGSGLWFGDLLRNFGLSGHVHSFDVVPITNLHQDNVTFHQANGRQLAKVLTLDFLARCQRPWLVIEDADHAYETTIAVLNFFHPLLKKDEYIVVEDGIISDLYPQSYPDYSSGPHRALREFLTQYGRQYLIDPEYCDFFGYNATWCSNGYLKRLG